jgi:hypothetical protein
MVNVNTISLDPSIPTENATCIRAGNQWTADAHRLGAALAKRGTGRAMRLATAEALTGGWHRGVVADLKRRGMISVTRGWVRITDAGLAAFPLNRCARWRQAADWPSGAAFMIDLDSQRARACGPLPRTDLAACDSRPAAWRSVSAHLCQPCRCASPARTKVPAQVVRGWSVGNVLKTDRLDPTLAIPSLEDVLRRAPARDRDAGPSGWWPGVGPTDKHPATRIGYPNGLRIEREYA